MLHPGTPSERLAASVLGASNRQGVQPRCYILAQEARCARLHAAVCAQGRMAPGARVQVCRMHTPAAKLLRRPVYLPGGARYDAFAPLVTAMFLYQIAHTRQAPSTP